MTATLAALLAVALAAPAQDEAALEKAAAEARRVLDATVAGDFGTVLDLTHPKIVELGGGREAVLAKIQTEMDGIKAQGIEFASGEVRAPQSSAEAGGTLFAVLPTSLTLKAPDATIKTRSFLVGLSSDGGKTWTFIDGSPGAEKIRELFPEIPDALKLPARQAPEIERGGR